MPKTKFQNVIFTLMMAFLMVYAMICYNISLNIGEMSNQVFLMAFHEMVIMWPIAFILEFFVVDNLAHKLAFRMVTPQDRPIVITLAISVMIICIMCPVMSLIATLLFKNAGSQFIAVWLQTTFMNFPVAFFWQLMYCGPFIRLIFRKMFPEKWHRPYVLSFISEWDSKGFSPCIKSSVSAPFLRNSCKYRLFFHKN